MPPLDLPSPAYGLPLLYAVNPVVAATEVAREHGAELAIGPRATEQAAHAAIRRSEQLAAAPDRPAEVEVDPDRLEAMAHELEAVRRVLLRTEAAAGAPASSASAEPRTARSTASPTAVVWVALGSIGLLLGSGAYLFGAPVAAAVAPLAVCLLIAVVVTANLRRSGRARRPAAAAPAPIDTEAAVRAARTVVAAQEQRWNETWSELGRSAPEPAELDDAIAHLRFGNLPALRRNVVVDLRDRPRPLVSVEPFRGLGPHRATALRELLDDLDPGILVAIVVGAGDH